MGTAPGGSARSFGNLADTLARQLIQILPGLDAAAFFRGLGRVTRDGKADPAAVDAFGKQWHIKFLGLPLRSD